MVSEAFFTLSPEESESRMAQTVPKSNRDGLAASPL